MLAAHRPDLLPSTTFFHKLDRASILDLTAWLPEDGRQTRVLMRGTYAFLPVDADTADAGRIVDMRVAPGAHEELAAEVTERYQDARFWRERSAPVLAAIAAAGQHELLFMFNLELILAVRRLLGIRTPIALSGPLRELSTAGLVDLCARYGARGYLSTSSARPNLKAEEFGDAGIELSWSEHSAWTSDSILTTWFMKQYPLVWVRRTSL